MFGRDKRLFLKFCWPKASPFTLPSEPNAYVASVPTVVAEADMQSVKRFFDLVEYVGFRFASLCGLLAVLAITVKELVRIILLLVAAGTGPSASPVGVFPIF